MSTLHLMSEHFQVPAPQHGGFPKIRGSFLGVPIIRPRVFRDLY